MECIRCDSFSKETQCHKHYFDIILVYMILVDLIMGYDLDSFGYLC